MGIESLLQQNLQNAGLAGSDRLARNAMFPQSQMDKTQYAVPSQIPTSAETIRADYDTPTNAYTGLPTQPFAEGGIARFVSGGINSTGTDNTDAKKATVADLYKKMLGREASAEETGQWIDYLNTENPNQGIMALADRLAQSEEGTAYGKKNPKEVYKTMAALSQADSPFAGMDTPYSNMRYVGTSNKTNYGGETTPDSVTTTHMFQDENGGIVTTDQFGQPIEYSPGRGWYEEQLRKKPDALRNYGYRNQTYLAAGPLDKTYNFNGVDVPISAAEYQVDPKTGQLITGKTGDFKPLERKPQDYNMWDDWAAPVAVMAIPALAAGAVYAAPYLAGEAAAGTVAAGTAEGAGAVGGAAAAEGAAAAGSGSWGLSPELAAELGLEGSTSGLGTSGVQGSAALESMGLNTGTASQGFGLKDAYNAYRYANMANKGLNMLSNIAGGGQGGSNAMYGNQGINNPYAMQAGFNPGPVRSGLGIDKALTTSTSPWANLTPNISLSKLSEFAPEYAAGGIAQGGGHLGGYSDGGRLLKGPGDGMSDHIPATIGDKQPARLAEGEFVIPADVVSHLGNGSTDAGAKQLYKMMDRIRKARTGNPKQGKQINPDKFTPKG